MKGPGGFGGGGEDDDRGGGGCLSQSVQKSESESDSLQTVGGGEEGGFPEMEKNLAGGSQGIEGLPSISGTQFSMSPRLGRDHLYNPSHPF